MCTEGRSCEDTVRRLPSARQGEGRQKKPNWLASGSWVSGQGTWTCSWTCSLPNCEEIHSYCFSHQVCATLLWEPLKTNNTLLVTRDECQLYKCSCEFWVGDLKRCWDFSESVWWITLDVFGVLLLLLFWLHPEHEEVLGPGVKPTAQQWCKP